LPPTRERRTKAMLIVGLVCSARSSSTRRCPSSAVWRAPSNVVRTKGCMESAGGARAGAMTGVAADADSGAHSPNEVTQRSRIAAPSDLTGFRPS